MKNKNDSDPIVLNVPRSASSTRTRKELTTGNLKRTKKQKKPLPLKTMHNLVKTVIYGGPRINL
ncbi:hypothetical protein BB561_000414 [Smittium simulii]|uniref:Uncharacterized protein n=1 Tax=Smittium simulii TaxID=133385 RepID=A0A2T9YZA8_9FUNG|nr:hypothetical protein BB561_000414 [Smittium simulii]